MGDLSEHFSRWEFACRCGCGTGMVDPRLIDRLEATRRLFGRGITVTNGCRCPVHNRAVGGEARSAHLTAINGVPRLCQAADLACIASGTRMNFLIAILTVAFPRVGVGENFLHVDLDPLLPQDVLWVYPAEKAKW